MAKTPASCKAKGRRFQQDIAKDISEIIGLAYGPDNDVASRGMGQNGTDIQLSPTARKAFPYSVECKCTERLDFWGSIKQARANCLEETDWLLVVRRNREKPVVVLDWERFLEIQKNLSN